MRLSIVMPALDEAAGIEAALAALAPLRRRGHEVIVVDGGSADATAALAAPLADRVLVAPRGRSVQMNRGASVATGDVLVFLHADTRLPAQAETRIADALGNGRHVWGRFDVAIEGRSPLLALVAGFMNLRSRLTGIATGDQAIFCRGDAFERAGGFPPIALMEDIAFSEQAKRLTPPACVKAKAITSGRRWDRQGTLRTILRMWHLRLAYRLGVHPDELARRYDAHA